MMSPNEKNKLKLRQICFIFLAFMPVTKIALLPSVLAGFCEERLFVATIFGFLLDIGVLLCCMRLFYKHQNSTLFNILETNFSKTFAKIVYFGYGVYFILKAIVPLLEQQDYVHNTLYEITPSKLVFIPLFIVSFYQSLKGLKILGRSADACIYLTALGFLLIFFLSIPEADFTNLLPIIQKPTYKPVNALFKSVMWFSDSVYLLLFLGHFEGEKRQTLKLTLSYLGASVVVILFMITFYAVFSSIANSRFFATPELTIYTLVDSVRFDYVAIFLLMFSQVFAIILPIYLSAKCFERAFALKKSLVPAIIINAGLCIFSIIFSGKLFKVLGVISNYFGYVFIFFGYVVPLLLLLIPKRGKNEVKA